MPFPECDRVIYDKSPLLEVVCQLRFPRILRINTTIPDKFQDAVIEMFPLYNEMIEHQQEIQINAQGESFTVPKIIHGESLKNYRFSTSDGKWHINLTSTFISLTTTDYSRWEVFRDKFDIAVKALISVYEPAFFERIGLRYIDVFNKTVLEAEKYSWSDLIKPYVVGIYSSEDVKNNVMNYNSNFEIKLNNDEGIARVVAGVGDVKGISGESFILDSDIYYIGQSQCDTVFPKLTSLHSEASRLLKWAITDKLHELMCPKELSK